MKSKEVVVNSERVIPLPKVEEVTKDKYELEPRRYANAIIKQEDMENLPTSLTNLDEISIQQVINFGSDKINKYTGRSTYGNIVESYMMSGAIPESQLRVNFTKEIDRNEKDDVNFIEYDYNVDFYNKVSLMAYANWNRNRLNVVYDEWKKVKYGGMTPDEMIRDSILGILTSSTNNKERLEAVKVASKIYGIEKNAKGTIINVFQQGNGKEFVDSVVATTGNRTYDITAGLDDGDDDE